MLNTKVCLVVCLLVFAAACNKPPANSTQNQAQDAVVPPRLLRGVNPQFPNTLWDKPGTVSVSALVGVDGKVTDAKVLSSPHPELNDLAMSAVKQWEFEPAKKAGQAIPFTVNVTVNFTPPAKGTAVPAASEHAPKK
jgi:protein TonB